MRERGGRHFAGPLGFDRQTRPQKESRARPVKHFEPERIEPLFDASRARASAARSRLFHMTRVAPFDATPCRRSARSLPTTSAHRHLRARQLAQHRRARRPRSRSAAPASPSWKNRRRTARAASLPSRRTAARRAARVRGSRRPRSPTCADARRSAASGTPPTCRRSRRSDSAASC